MSEDETPAAVVSRRDEIVDAARGLLEEEGRDALTMRRLADRLGIKAPSLYKHFRDKRELEVSLTALALQEVGSELAGSRDLRELARRYRRWALRHAHLYRLATDVVPGDELPAGTEAPAEAPILEVAVNPDRARAAWAFAHGMVELELAGRFTPGADLDAAWSAGVDAFEATTGSQVSAAPRTAIYTSFRLD
jgi:AcrR family transcriptional regulator